MERQKIANLVNGYDNESSKFATTKWYFIDSESRGNYSDANPIKYLTESLESSLCDYSDAYILVAGNIAVTGGGANTKVAFKNCAPFRKCRTEINETFVDDAQHINIAMPMYNLIEYSDDYSDTSGSLWQFKRDEIEVEVELSLKWDKNCILSSEDGNSVFAITDAKLYVLIVTLLVEDNAKLSKLLGKRFKRPVYWNKYKVIRIKHIIETIT